MGAIFFNLKRTYTHSPPSSPCSQGASPKAIPCGQFLIYPSTQILLTRQHTSLPPPPPNLRPTEKHTVLPVLHLAFFHLVGISWRQLQTSTTRPMSFFLTLWCMPGVGWRQLMGQIWSAAYFCKYHLTESQPCSFVHVLSIVTCELQRQSWEAATETIYGPKSLKYLLSCLL